jgi:hypothetical protein
MILRRLFSMDFFYHFLFRRKIRFRVGPTFGFLPLKPALVNQPGKPFFWPRQEELLRCENRRARPFFLRLAKFPQRGAGWRFKGQSRQEIRQI